MRLRLSQYALFIMLLLTAGISGCGGGSDGEETIQQPSGGNGNSAVTGLVSLDLLEPGMCADIVDEIHGIEFLMVVACNESHHYEFAGTLSLADSGSDYPGSLQIERQAYKGCRSVFEHHTGSAYDGRELGIEVITPSVSSWSDGDTSALCFVVNADRTPLTSSVGM